MTKEVFLRELGRRLSQLPADEVQRRQAYYEELLDDMMEDGIAEEAAVAKLGDLSEIVDEILREQPLPTLVKSRLHPKNGWTVAAITLVVLGAPLWIPLLFALVVTVAAIGLAVVAVIASLFISVFAVALAGVMLIVRGVWLFSLNSGYALFSIGGGFLMLGFVCLAFLAAEYACIGVSFGSRWLFRAIKGLLVAKED